MYVLAYIFNYVFRQAKRKLKLHNSLSTRHKLGDFQQDEDFDRMVFDGILCFNLEIQILTEETRSKIRTRGKQGKGVKETRSKIQTCGKQAKGVERI
jgi:hypothetical protein